MTRDAFLEGFTERLRHVLQAHAREIDAFSMQRKACETNTEAAIDELARYLCDAFDRVSPLPLSGDPRMSPPRYEIRTVADFLKVPEDRVEDCVREFRAFLHMARHAPLLLDAVMDETIGEPGAVRFQLVDCFNWIDDGLGEVGMDVQWPEREPERVFTLPLNDDYRAKSSAGGGSEAVDP